MRHPDERPRPGSAAATGKMIQRVVLVAVVIGVALFGYARWRKAHPVGEQSGPASSSATDEPAGRALYLQPDPAPKEPKDMALDLGEGVKMEFVWIKPLNIWVGKYEVTNREYRRHDPEHRSGDFQAHSMDGDQQPVFRVTYEGAKSYAEWVTHVCREQIPPRYVARLLSGEEALAIAHCGDDREYPWGPDWPPPEDWNYNSEESAGRIPKIAGRRDKWPVTCPVDESGQNDWGLHGVGGNVLEWTTRRFLKLKGYPRELDGASWYYGGREQMRSAYRSKLRPVFAPYYVGFRVVVGY